MERISLNNSRGRQGHLLPALAVLVAVALFAPVTHAADADGDGLSDAVEASLGSNPLHKDVFVEVDWLVVGDRNMKPRDGLTAMLMNAFAIAPVSNPDGTKGITLHIDLSDEIPDARDAIGHFNPDGWYDWSDFDAIKAAYFTPARANTHHYCLFPKTIGDSSGNPTSISGISRNGSNFTAGANDFIVSLGHDSWWNWLDPMYYVYMQTGTMMHELGHNLGLMHGGVDHVNYKPNFLSVMNYSFQIWGVPRTNAGSMYDYSRILLPDLNEKRLDETKGLTSAARGYATAWFLKNGPASYQRYDTPRANRKIDWNKDANYATNAQADINRDGKKSSALKGNCNEWTRITFTGGQVGGGVPRAALPQATVSPCMTFEEARQQLVPAMLPNGDPIEDAMPASGPHQQD